MLGRKATIKGIRQTLQVELNNTEYLFSGLNNV